MADSETFPRFSLAVERASAFTDDDLAALCEAADAAIIGGGGFGWVNPPGRIALQRYFKGLLLVPERSLYLARLDGVIVGSALVQVILEGGDASTIESFIREFRASID